MTVIPLQEHDKIANGGSGFLNRLEYEQNWQKSSKMSQKCSRWRENRDRGGFCDSAATEYWDLATS